MTSTLYPLGGVEIGQPVIIVAYFNPNNPGSKSNKKLMVLTYNANATPSSLVFENAVIDTSSGGTGGGGQVYVNPALGVSIVQYTTALNTSDNSLTFTTNTPGGDLSLSSGSIPFVTGAGPDGDPTPVTLSQTAAQPWTNPFSFLTGVQYTLSNMAGVNAQWYYNSKTSGTPVYQSLFTTIGILPTSYYYGCNSSAVGRKSAVGDVLTIAYCSISGKQLDSKGPCAGSNIPTAGWTTSADCVNGASYSYCPVGTNCSGTCKSTCPTEGDVCTYVPATQGNSFECRATTTETNNNTRIWLIVGIVVGIIVFIILIFVFRSIFHKKDADEGLDMDPELDSYID